MPNIILGYYIGKNMFCSKNIGVLKPLPNMTLLPTIACQRSIYTWNCYPFLGVSTFDSLMVIGIRGLRCAKVSYKEASSSKEREDPRRDPSVNSSHVHGANSRHKKQVAVQGEIV